MRKFGCAFRGVYFGMRGQDSFLIQLPCAVAVFALAAWLNVSRTQWSLLVLAVALVLVAELMNSAVEHLVRVVHPDRHAVVGEALDIASGAVLVATGFSGVVGGLVFIPAIWHRWVAG